MLFKNLNICFVGVPKNASESVHAALMTLDGCDRIHEHKPMSIIIMEHGMRNVDTMYSMGVSRNPYDRFASAYRFLQKNDEWQMSIDETLDYIETMRSEDILTVYHEMNPVLHSQTFYLYDQQGKRIVNHVIRYENLTEEWNDFLNVVNGRYGSNHAIELPRLNSATDGKQWYEMLTTSQMKRISQLYSEDFANFQYSKSFESAINQMRMRKLGLI